VKYNIDRFRFLHNLMIILTRLDFLDARRLAWGLAPLLRVPATDSASACKAVFDAAAAGNFKTAAIGSKVCAVRYSAVCLVLFMCVIPLSSFSLLYIFLSLRSL